MNIYMIIYRNIEIYAFVLQIYYVQRGVYMLMVTSRIDAIELVI